MRLDGDQTAMSKKRKTPVSDDPADQTFESKVDTPPHRVDLGKLPVVTPEQGRWHPDVLRARAIEQALHALSQPPWPSVLIVDPCELALTWKKKQMSLLIRALQSGLGTALEELNLWSGSVNMCFPSADVTTAVVRCCVNLKSLEAREAPWSAESLSLLESLSELRFFAVGGIAVSLRSPVPQAALTSLVHCRRLERVILDTVDLTDDTVTAIFDSARPSLTQLTIHAAENLTGRSVCAVARTCPNMSSLDLLNCSSVGSDGVAALAQCKRLKDLNLQRVTGVQRGLRDMCKGSLSQLQSLGLSCCTLEHEDVESLCTSLPALTNLDLNGARGAGVDRIGLMRLASLSGLRRLSLNGCRLPSADMDAVSRGIAEGCPKLEFMDLNNTNLTHEGLQCWEHSNCKVTTINCDSL